MATPSVESTLYNEKASSERDVTSKTIVNGQATGLSTEGFILPSYSFTLKRLIKGQSDLDFVPSLYVALKSQLAGSYAYVRKELRAIIVEITKLTTEIVSLFHQMRNADLTFDDIWMSLDLLKRCPVCHS